MKKKEHIRTCIEIVRNEGVEFGKRESDVEDLLVQGQNFGLDFESEGSLANQVLGS